MAQPIFRLDEIVKHCRGKEVLHLGFIQHEHVYQKVMEEGHWLHAKIAEVAKSLVGLDYLEQLIPVMREKYGYECYFADVTRLDDLDLDRKFEIIVCGELIEHLDNPGLMLDGIKRFMSPETELLITTPNPWAHHRLKSLSRGIMENEWVNEEHACWYSFHTLRQLLERKGYEEVDYGFTFGPTRSGYQQLTRGFLGTLHRIKWHFNYRQPHSHDGLLFRARIAG